MLAVAIEEILCLDYWFHRHGSQLCVNSYVQVDTFVKLV